MQQMTIDAVKRKLCFHCGTPPSAQVRCHAGRRLLLKWLGCMPSIVNHVVGREPCHRPTLPHMLPHARTMPCHANF